VGIRNEHLQAVRRFALQVLNISLAVIIALAFEGLVERRRIHSLVATATDHMRSELADNRKDVSSALAHVERGKREVADGIAYLDKLLAAIEAKLAGKEAPNVEGGLSFHAFQVLLAATSRSTAEATGALGHMPYERVKLFAEAYVYQQAVQQNLDRCAEQGWVVTTLMTTDLNRLSVEQLRELRSALQAIERTLRQLGSQMPTMIGFYDRALAGG
jgi:hypothetical protein